MKKRIAAAITGLTLMSGLGAAPASAHVAAWTLYPKMSARAPSYITPVTTGACLDLPTNRWMSMRHTWYGMQFWSSAGAHVEYTAQNRILTNRSGRIARCWLYN